MFDLLITPIIIVTYSLFGRISHQRRVSVFTLIFRTFFLLPNVKRIALRNLEIAFPSSTPSWRAEILRKNTVEMARLAADAVRLPEIDEEWVKKHVVCPILPLYREKLKEQKPKGLIIATGHLGSFELLGHSIGLFGLPVAAVARRFRSPKLDRWWRGMREARGNKIIDRKGAFKEIISAVSQGLSAAVLFDQNVTKNHAVFVDWFGLPAATTKTVALAVLRCEVPVFVASMRYCGIIEGIERYTIESACCDFTEVINDAALSTDQKVSLITQRLSDEYSKMIVAFPEGWFWIHRRWKTRPENEVEGIYS